MVKPVSNLTCGIDPDWMSKKIQSHQPYIDKLNALCARGIDLNPWQANELLMGGRAYGKTYLAFVRIAEDALERGMTVTRTVAEKYDKDIASHNMVQLFLRELKDFLIEHYDDVFNITLVNSNELSIRLKLSKCWWKQQTNK